jgi:hypothetical protein
MTAFALGIVVFRQESNASSLGMLYFVMLLPPMLLSGMAGRIVDKRDRRLVLIVADIAGALVCCWLLAVVLSGQVRIWHVYAFTALTAVAGSFQGIASIAIIGTSSTRRTLSAANAFRNVQNAIPRLIAPLGGLAIVMWLGLRGILVVDIVSFVVAIGTAVLLTPALRAGLGGAKRNSAIGGELSPRRLVNSSALLRRLQFLLVANLFVLSAVGVWITPLILSEANEAVLGFTLAAAGVGALLGNAFAGAVGARVDAARAVAAAPVVSGIGLIVLGGSKWAILSALALGIYFFADAAGTTLNYNVWHLRVPSSFHGRVFGFNRSLCLTAALVALLISGPAVDYLLVPAVAASGTPAGGQQALPIALRLAIGAAGVWSVALGLSQRQLGRESVATAEASLSCVGGEA